MIATRKEKEKKQERKKQKYRMNNWLKSADKMQNGKKKTWNDSGKQDESQGKKIDQQINDYVSIWRMFVSHCCNLHNYYSRSDWKPF